MTDFRQPFRIGRVEIPNRVVLSPMAGVTTSAFRRHIKRHGVGLVVTEMVSAYGLLYANRRTESYLDFSEEERPIAVQLFGDKPEVVAEAARRVLARAVPPDILDLNMGCPVKKVVKTGAGSALVEDPEGAAAVVRALVEAAGEHGVPVTVKIRSGLTAQRIVAVELARILEEAGAAAIGIHPRTAEQKYSGEADHRVTAAVVRAVKVPVMASGDMFSLQAARRIATETGAAAVMLARGVQGDPWLVRRLLSGRELAPASLAEAVADLRSLLSLAADDMGEERAARWIRSHLAWYLRPRGVPGRVVDELRRYGDARSLDDALGGVLKADGS